MLKISNPSKLTIPAATTSLTSLRCLHSKPISSSSSSSSSSLSVPTQEQIARLVIDQKSPSQALQTFKWASKIPNFTHSQSTYRALIYKLCNFRRFDTVKEVLDEMPHSIKSLPDESVFVTIIRGLGRARLIKEVIKVLDLVSRFNMTPSLKIFNSILDVLVKEDIDLARAFYRNRMMQSGVHGDDYTYGILMKGLCLTNRIGDGFKLLQVMKSRGIKPSTIIYNTLIHALCKNEKVGRSRSLMNEMEAPNEVTFNILISAYCKEENLVNALVMLEKSFSFGFIPDVVTVTKVLELLCNAGRVMEAVEISERVENKGGVIDVVACNTLIKGFCRLGKVKVGCQFLKGMERKGCLPNVDSYNILIAGFCESGMLESALDMFNNMKADGISWNSVTYDILIRGLCSRGQIVDGFKILELMEDSNEGSKNRISPYNSMLYGLYKENQLDEALQFLKQMENLFPKGVDRSFKVLGFCADGNVEDAKGTFDQMIEEGGSPNVLVYDCLIHLLCQEERVQEAFQLMNEMAKLGYFPIASTLNALITEFCKQGKVGTALKLMEDMVARGSLPDTLCYSSMINALCRKGDFHNALKLLLQMVDKSILPDYSTWDSLLLFLSQQTKNIHHVNKLLQAIIET
ncbi:Pentatricopeptide repeat-containing protein [Melia azedarach]|uniref:Pentatricopeptide repeat-containing protein n=1 Tax=Melia azedarach TaxID=155640 RepID=A0ACC1XRB2_MELAZ|nr:Pentatricopeptide repeat-containing protein [Melia azedarach]